MTEPATNPEPARCDAMHDLSDGHDSVLIAHCDNHEPGHDWHTNKRYGVEWGATNGSAAAYPTTEASGEEVAVWSDEAAAITAEAGMGLIISADASDDPFDDAWRDIAPIDITDVRTIIREIERGAHDGIPREIGTKLDRLLTALVVMRAHRPAPTTEASDSAFITRDMDLATFGRLLERARTEGPSFSVVVSQQVAESVVAALAARDAEVRQLGVKLIDQNTEAERWADEAQQLREQLATAGDSERAKIVASLRAQIADVATVRPWLNRHQLDLEAGVGSVIASIAHDVEQGDL